MTVEVTVDATGIHAPTFAECLADLQAAFAGIYGADAYLAADSQDGQLLAVFANAWHDANQAAVAVFNAFSPTTAQGTDLSSLVKINGLARSVATKSTATVTIVGVAGTTIFAGVLQDQNDNLWDLPATVEIPSSGEIDVTATAQEDGAIAAQPGTITTVYNPTRGWQSVTNADAATPGSPVESDAELRRRQAVSTAQPGQAIIEAVEAAVGNVAGVHRFAVYENATDTTDSDGVPGHSIAVVESGGDDDDVAQAIGSRKPPGIQTYGDVTVVIEDSFGIGRDINFFHLDEITVTVAITVRALAGWILSTENLIKAAVAEFLNRSEVGEDSYLARLYIPATLNGDAAVSATGMTQSQLDAVSRTYQVLAINQSRASNPAATTVSGGPYAATATAAAVADADKIYAGSRIRFVLDNAANHDVVVSSVVGSSVNFLGYPVPTSRNIPTASNVYLLSDVLIGFKEAAICETTDVSISVVS